MNLIKLALFDLDGTLLDSNGVWDHIDRLFLAECGLPYDEEYTRQVSQLDYHSAALYTIDRYQLKTTPEALMRHWEEMSIKEYRENVGLKPGAKDIVKRLREYKVPLALVTLAPPILYEPALERLGLLKDFEYFASANRDGFTKDSAEVYEAICALYDVKPQEVIGFEDSLVAMQSMVRAGLTAVGIQDHRNLEKEKAFRNLSEHYYQWQDIPCHFVDQEASLYWQNECHKNI